MPVDKMTTMRGEKKTLAGILEKKSKEALIGLLMEFAARHPEIKRSILEADQLQNGKIDQLASALRKEIKVVTGEEVWYNPWKDEGNLPDYSHIQEQLAALLKKGHADTVVDLGLELWKRGNEQIEHSHDEGDTACEVGECMEIAFQAVTASTLSAPEQLLWMIDISLDDQFSICEFAERFIRSRAYGKEAWHEVVRVLQARLKNMPIPRDGDFSSRYQRERIVSRLVDALERSGGKEKVLPLLAEEAPRIYCYPRLVDRLLQAGQSETARKWCIEGFRKTMKENRGIASGLQERLRELAGRERKFDLVAAYRAQDFLAQLSPATYLELKKAGEKIGRWPEVRAAVLYFLENGKIESWPLPNPEVAAESDKRDRRQYPDLDTLIDIAILEKRFDDVVQLYHALRKKSLWGIDRGKAREVAEAVSATHPDISLAIWKKLAEGEIKLVKPKAYEEAAIYLRKMLKVYRETNRLAEWQNLVRSLRAEHKAKRRLLEVLDGLTD